jgi:hypothetical protein
MGWGPNKNYSAVLVYSDIDMNPACYFIHLPGAYKIEQDTLIAGGDNK